MKTLDGINLDTGLTILGNYARQRNFFSDQITAYDVLAQQNAYSVLERQIIDGARSSWPAWFEPASEWNKIA